MSFKGLITMAQTSLLKETGLPTNILFRSVEADILDKGLSVAAP